MSDTTAIPGLNAGTLAPSASVVQNPFTGISTDYGNAGQAKVVSDNLRNAYYPTVVSDQGVRDKIPSIIATANNNTASFGGNPNSATTNNNSSDGSSGAYGLDPNSPSFYSDYLSRETDAQTSHLMSDPNYMAGLTMIRNAGTNADAATQASLAALESEYQSQYANEVAIQKASTAGVEQTLNLGGSSRYAPISSSGILSEKHRADLATLTALGSANAQNKAKLNQAIADNDYKTAQSLNDEMSKVRTQAQGIAQGIVSNVQATAKDARDKLATGIADASSVALKNGAPPGVMAKIKASTNVPDAYAAASGYGGGANIDVQKITNVDGSSSIVRVDKNTGKIVGTTNIGGGDPSSGGASGGTSSGTTGGNTPLKDTQSFLIGLTPEGATNFNKLNDADKSNVMQLINGDALLSDLFSSRGVAGGTLRQQALQKAQSVDPTFSENTNKIRFNFNKAWNDPTNKIGMTRNAINTALGHLAELSTLSKALPQNIVQKMNSVDNVLSKNLGDPSVTNFRIALNALASELATTYKGGIPNEGEIKQWEQSLAENFSKYQFKGAFDTTANLLSSKITASRYQYKTTMGKDYNQSIIDPDKRQALIDSDIDPKQIVKENLPGQPKTGIAAQIDMATSQGYQPKDIVTHLEADPAYGEKIKNAESAGWTPEAIIQYLNTL